MVSSTRSDVAGIGESDALNAGLSGDERRTLARALDFAASVYGEKPLGTGEPAYGHAIGLARNVAELRLDADARVAGLLFSVPEYLSDGEEKLAASFGAAVASLVAGISRLNSLRVITRTVAMGKDSQSQAEVLRKMLLAMVEDIRVVLLRLASRTQTLRWLSRGPEAGRRELARETLDIYAPLASRTAAASASAQSSMRSPSSPTSSPAPESGARSPAGRSTSTASIRRCAPSRSISPRSTT